MESKSKDIIHILFVEDTYHDMVLAIRELKKENIKFISKIVETEQDLIWELNNFQPDLIISDYSMPVFDGMKAINVVKQYNPEIPIIVFTGSINEETAVKCMKAGASDYVLKEKIKRLPFAVKEVLEKKQILKEKKETENELLYSNFRFKEFAEKLTDVIFITDIEGNITYISPFSEKIFGIKSDLMIGKHYLSFVSEKDIDCTQLSFKKLIETGTPTTNFNLRLKNKDNYEINCELNASLIMYDSEKNGVIGLIRDVSERKEWERVLLESKEKAELSNKIKDAFIANISHEIRTPLNGILGMTELIEEAFKEYATPVESNFFKTIKNSSSRLIRTIDLILNFSRIQIGDFPIKPTNINLLDLVNKLLIEFENIAQKKGLIIRVFSEIKNPVILYDEYCLSLILSNIIDNALKFTNKGYVNLKIYLNNSNLMLDISDTGKGISPEFLPFIFNPYNQEEVGYSRSYEGIGLGLSLSKQLSDLNNSEISVKSIRNQGSTFSIAFKNTIINNQNNNIQNIMQNAEIQLNSEEKRKLLIVEDDFSSQELLGIILKKFFDIHFVISGEEALELVKDIQFDLILMDISLKGSINGLQLTKVLRNNPLYNKTPIIAVTAHAFENDRIASLEAGCNDYISKPIRKNDLLSIVNKNLV